MYSSDISVTLFISHWPNLSGPIIQWKYIITVITVIGHNMTSPQSVAVFDTYSKLMHALFTLTIIRITRIRGLVNRDYD